MVQVTVEQIIKKLRQIKGPDLKEDIVTLGLVSDILVKEDIVYLSIRIDPACAVKLEPMRLAVEQVVNDMKGVTRAIVALTAQVEDGQAIHRRPDNTLRSANKIPDVKQIIAIASGKGGVGKSTLAVNLALALRERGLQIGLLDADIYGPSIPHLLGVTGRPTPLAARAFAPLEGHGLRIMSMGFLVNEETPTIWRGPMISATLTRMLRDVQWGKLDILLVDMPPGTGDASLTLAQKVSLSGVLIVSTPQDLALLDARKSINMFRRMGVTILGIVENMSYFFCPYCGERADIFGNGGAYREAKKIGVPFLGFIPLDMAIREASDAGKPIFVSSPNDSHAKIYRDIAVKLITQIQNLEGVPPVSSSGNAADMR